MTYINPDIKIYILKKQILHIWPLDEWSVFKVKEGLFQLYLLFPLSPSWLLSDLTIYIWVKRWVSYKKKHELSSRGEHQDSCPVYGGIPVVHLFSALCLFFLSIVLSVPSICSVSGLSILHRPFDFSNVSLPSIITAACLVKKDQITVLLSCVRHDRCLLHR